MSLNRKHLPFFIAVLLGIGIYIGSKLSTNTSNHFANSKNVSKQKFSRLIDYLEYEYVDPVDTRPQTFKDVVGQASVPPGTTL